MLRVKRAMGAVTITTLTVMGLGAVGSPAAEAAQTDLCASARTVGGSLSGTGLVGDTLTATLPTWSGLATSSTLTWLRNGSAFRTGGLTYSPVASDAGSSIALRQDVDLLTVGLCSWTSNAVAIAAAVDPTPVLPTPVLPAPVDPTAVLPTPVDPTPVLPTPVDPTAVLPTPVDPTAVLPTPVLPTTVLPTPVLPTLLQGPALSGLGVIGERLSVVDPVFSDMSGVSTTYQWLRDGAPVDGETGASYLTQAADVGHDVAARVISTVGGTEILGTVTQALRIASLPIDVRTAPVVLGVPQVGQTLTVGAPSWSVDGVTTGYAWLRDGTPIAGQQGPSYVLTPADLGLPVSVRVTASKPGFVDGLATSPPVTVLRGAAPSPTAEPQLSGVPEVGRTLVVTPGTWGVGPDPTITYTWLRDGAPIPGATSDRYTLTAADATRMVAVRVVADRLGFETGSFQTAPAQVARMRSFLSARLVSRVIGRTQRGVLRLTVRVPAGAPRTGAVTVLERRKIVGRGAFKRGGRGVTSIRLARLEPGAHRLKAVYAGTPTVAGSSARVVRLTVRR